MKQVCAFCGRAKGQVKGLFRGPELLICNECIEDYNSRLHQGEVGTSRELREELEQTVADSFRKMVGNLDLGPLHDKYQLLMKVKFKEEPGGPTFEKVFDEFKRGVEQVITADDYQTHYDLGIAYHEMGLKDDAFRELIQSMRYSLRLKNWEKAIEVLSVIFYIGSDPKQVIAMVSEIFQERG